MPYICEGNEVCYLLYFLLLTKNKKQMEKFTINKNPEKVFDACKNINNFLTREEKKKITVSKDGKPAKMSVPMIGDVNMRLTSSDDDKIIRISCPEIGTVLAGKVSETIQNGQRMSEIKLVIEKCRPNISWTMGGKLTENIMTPILECSPSDISGISSSTTT